MPNSEEGRRFRITGGLRNGRYSPLAITGGKGRKNQRRRRTESLLLSSKYWAAVKTRVSLGNGQKDLRPEKPFCFSWNRLKKEEKKKDFVKTRTLLLLRVRSCTSPICGNRQSGKHREDMKRRGRKFPQGVAFLLD